MDRHQGVFSFGYAPSADRLDELREVWRVAFDEFHGQLAYAIVDLYPSPNWQAFHAMPSASQQAWEVLYQRAASERNWPDHGDEYLRRSLADIEVPFSDGRLQDALRVFGPDSIRAELYCEGHDQPIIECDDGTSLGFYMRATELARLVNALERAGLDPDNLEPEQAIRR